MQNLSHDCFIKACHRQKADRVPVWFMRQAGRYMKEYQALRQKYSILELAQTPELACEVTLQPIRKLGVDAAILFSDLLLPLIPMGARVRFAPGPVIDNPVRNLSDIRRLREFNPEEDLACVMAAIRLIRHELKDVPLIGFAGAPFTVASYLIEGGPSKDFAKTKNLMLGEPKAWDALMRKIRGVISAHLKAQIKAGAQAVQLFDSWVGALSPDQYRENVLPHSRFVLDSLRPLKVPVIHFGTGTSGFLEDFAKAGGDVIGVDWRIDLSAAFRRIGPHQALQGNLDPVLLLGSRSPLKRAVTEILKHARGKRGFIFNLGHGILPQTPLENVKAVVDWVHKTQ